MRNKQALQTIPVYQHSLDLVKNMYVLTGVFPDHEALLLSKQLKENAIAVSVGISKALQITDENRTQYLENAQLALIELDTCLIIAQKLNYLTEEDIEIHCGKCENIKMQINALMHKLHK